MKTTTEMIGELKAALKESVKEKGYEETKKRYIQHKKKSDWVCLLLILLAIPLSIMLNNLLQTPTWTTSVCVMLFVLLLPFLLMKNYDLEFDELIKEDDVLEE